MGRGRRQGLIGALLALGLLGSCGDAGDPATPAPPAESRQLVLYDWVEDMPQSVLDAFESKYEVEVILPLSTAGRALHQQIWQRYLAGPTRAPHGGD